MNQDRRDFFISHSSADERWAEWIALQLERAGYLVELDLWEWSPGENFISAMEIALQRAERVIAVYSASYFIRPYAMAEHSAAVATAFADKTPRVIPVQVEECEIPALYRTLIRINLVDVDEYTAAERLLTGVQGSAHKPILVRYPGIKISSTVQDANYPGKLPSTWKMPPRNRFFVGRRALIEKIRTTFHQSDPQAVAVTSLQGVGGIGKTQIAIEYGYEYSDHYNIAWWVDADNSNLIVDGLLGLAEELSLARTTPEQTIERLWSELAGRRDWLIIYDNVDSTSGIEHLRPPPNGHWLITSRNPSIARLAELIEVTEFDRNESLRLIGSRVPKLSSTDAELIAEALGDLPLAIEQASYFLADTGFTAAEYLQFLAEEPIGAGLAEVTIDRHPGLVSVVVTAIERLEANDHATAHVLNLLSILAPEQLPVTPDRSTAKLPDIAFGARFGNVARTADIIRVSTRSGLVKRVGRSLKMHRLVQLILSDRLSDEAIRKLEDDAALILATSMPGNPSTPSDWLKFAVLAPHVKALCARRGKINKWYDNDTFTKLIPDFVDYFYRAGRYQEGLDLAQLCLPVWRSSLGETDSLTLRLTSNLGMCVTGLGNYAAATEIYRDLFAQYTNTLGPFANSTLRAGNNIGVTLNGSGKFDEAVRILTPTLENFRKTAGPSDPETLRAANNLAEALIGAGAYEESIQLATENLELIRKVLPLDHPDALICSHTMGAALSNTHPERAYALLRETLNTQMRVLGADHPDTARTASTLRRIDDSLST